MGGAVAVGLMTAYQGGLLLAELNVVSSRFAVRWVR